MSVKSTSILTDTDWVQLVDEVRSWEDVVEVKWTSPSSIVIVFEKPNYSRRSFSIYLDAEDDSAAAGEAALESGGTYVSNAVFYARFYGDDKFSEASICYGNHPFTPSNPYALFWQVREWYYYSAGVPYAIEFTPVSNSALYVEINPPERD